MTGDEKNVAAHALPAGRSEPIGATALDQLDELELVLGKVAAEAFLLVGRADGDRADGLFVRPSATRPCREKQHGQETDSSGNSHEPRYRRAKKKARQYSEKRGRRM
jgi:hypothetical protein